MLRRRPRLIDISLARDRFGRVRFTHAPRRVPSSLVLAAPEGPRPVGRRRASGLRGGRSARGGSLLPGDGQPRRGDRHRPRQEGPGGGRVLVGGEAAPAGRERTERGPACWREGGGLCYARWSAGCSARWFGPAAVHARLGLL